ncbi:hypothetical protein Poly51_00180 [Rubripirellula tenax]|uniref:DUF1207 domain-containing protein n=1 Tax=Rubripirellula tenax TaxID=2528015 RepID=A0A5C6FD97_9BACT|nr:DUF1207 domain-containing protein [Rubripirellula tenax]TWU59746.1 hypothetical protein Poly51_00180 [Rubripirellula tenax]
MHRLIFTILTLVVIAPAVRAVDDSDISGDELFGDVQWVSVEGDPESPLLFHQAKHRLDLASVDCDRICRQATGATVRSDTLRCDNDRREYQVLPDGLMWRSYLAGPQEPRIGTVIQYDADDNIYCDASLGGRVGLLRYGTLGSKNPRGWQWDLEGGVITRLNVRESEDVDSMDYRIGTLITRSEGDWRFKFGYFHISSHVGDEYIERNPTFERVNYVTESAIWGVGYVPSESVRLYGEFAYAFSVSGGAQPVQIQTGAEYTPPAKSVTRGAPFAAINLNFREAVGYDVSSTAQIGWGFQSLESGRRMRFGLQCGAGPTSQYEFFERREEYIGIGSWFDY